MSYSYAVQWNLFNGRTPSVAVWRRPDEEKAKLEVISIATRMGYTPPRWWQFWRWGEKGLYELQCVQ